MNALLGEKKAGEKKFDREPKFLNKKSKNKYARVVH